MTRQKAGYPLDYSKGSADAGKDRLLSLAARETGRWARPLPVFRRSPLRRRLGRATEDVVNPPNTECVL